MSDDPDSDDLIEPDYQAFLEGYCRYCDDLGVKDGCPECGRELR